MNGRVTICIPFFVGYSINTKPGSVTPSTFGEIDATNLVLGAANGSNPVGIINAKSNDINAQISFRMGRIVNNESTWSVVAIAGQSLGGSLPGDALLKVNDATKNLLLGRGAGIYTVGINNTTGVKIAGTSGLLSFQPAGTGTITSFTPTQPASNLNIVIPDAGTTTTNMLLGVKQYIPISTATTLTVAQSGSLIGVLQSGTAFTITLPPVSLSGVNFQFQVITTGIGAVTLAFGGQTYVVANNNGPAGVATAAAGVSNFLFTGTTAQIGDNCTVTRIGNTYSVVANGQASGYSSTS